MAFNNLNNLERAKYWYRANPGGGGETYPSVLDDGNTMAWFDYTKGITQVTGVSKWEDQSGNGNDLLQATGVSQPSINANGVLFDGSNDFMKCVAFTLDQPIFYYLVFKQITWVSNRLFFDGDAGTSVFSSQRTSSPNISLNAGAYLGLNNNLSLNTYAILRALANSTSSKTIIDDTTPVTGNIGTDDAGGLTLGGTATGLSGYSNIEVKEFIVRKVADTSPNELIIYNYLKDKYGL